MIAEWSLKVLRKHFHIPNVSTRMRYLKWPNSIWVFAGIFLSFAICTSGFMYCLINETPMYGYTLSEYREVVVSMFELNSFDAQFFSEAWISFFLVCLISGSFVAMYWLVGGDEISGIKLILIRCLAYSMPLWVFLLVSVIRTKVSDYFPGILPVIAHKKARYSSPITAN